MRKNQKNKEKKNLRKIKQIAKKKYHEKIKWMKKCMKKLINWLIYKKYQKNEMKEKGRK